MYYLFTYNTALHIRASLKLIISPTHTFCNLFDSIKGKHRGCIIGFPEELGFLLLGFIALLLLPRATAAAAAPLGPAVACPGRRLLLFGSIITIKSLSSEHAARSHINWSLDPIQAFHVYLYIDMAGSKSHKSLI
jgi:hypothetical protein